MGFLDKVKKGLNIGGAKVTVQPPGALQNGQEFELKATIAGGDLEQKVSSATARLVMKATQSSYGINQQKSTSTKTVTLSEVSLPGFALTAGETKELVFAMVATAPSDGTNQEGMMGTLAKMNKMATGAKQELSIEVTADIEGSIDASDTIEVIIT